MKGHIPQIAEYDWTIGTRCRWDCSCGEGGGGYTSVEAADSAFQAHLRRVAMWQRHLRGRAEGSESR